MKRHFFLQYLNCTRKRVGITLLPLLLGLLVVAVLCAGALAGAGYLLYHLQVFEPMTVSIVLPQEEQGLRLYTELASSMDSVKRLCRFSYDSEETAMQKLHTGEAQAAIVLPVHFEQDINDGINTPTVIYLVRGSTLHTALFRELLGDGVSLIQTAEAGIYAVTDEQQAAAGSAAVSGGVLSRADTENLLTGLYLQAALNRELVYTPQEVSVFGHLTLLQYLTASGLVTVLLFAGLCFGFLYRREDRRVERVLQRNGISAVQIGAAKVLVLTAVLWILMALLWTGLRIGIPAIFGTETIVFSDQQAAAALFALLPVSFAAAALLQLLYTLAGDPVHGAMLLLLTGFFLLLAGGCILPADMLPPSVALPGRYLPTACWQQDLTALMTGHYSIRQALCELGYGALFLGMGDFFLWKNI